jgi:hypothetical protein
MRRGFSIQQAKASLIFFLIFVSVFISSLAATKSNELPKDIAQVLSAPETTVLYSLEPWECPDAQDESFHHFKVLGHTKLEQKQAGLAIEEFCTAISRWDGKMSFCFDPRQALRVTAGKRTYDLLLCYACHLLYVYQGDKLVFSHGVSGSPKVLNELLSEAKIRLSTTGNKENRATPR